MFKFFSKCSCPKREHFSFCLQLKLQILNTACCISERTILNNGFSVQNPESLQAFFLSSYLGSTMVQKQDLCRLCIGLLDFISYFPPQSFIDNAKVGNNKFQFPKCGLKVKHFSQKLVSKLTKPALKQSFRGISDSFLSELI